MTFKGESRPSGSLISGPKYCGDPPEPNPNEIRLMSYNMFGWNALQDPVKTENMYRIIRAFNPDLLGTQESEREEEIASNIGNDYRLKQQALRELSKPVVALTWTLPALF